MKVEGKLRLESNLTATLGFYFKNTIVDVADWTKRAPSLVLRGRGQEELNSKSKPSRAYEPHLWISEQRLVMESIALFVYPWAAKRFDNTRVVLYVDDLTMTRTDWMAQLSEGEVIKDIDGYNVFPVTAVTDEKILSSRPLIPDSMKRESLKMTEAGDEYESLSFAIVSEEQLNGEA